jgi:23S rRNA (adenine2503-C2)-methyltransferase
MNPVAHTPWQPSPAERVEAFATILRSAGLDTTVRRNRGLDIGAACGQLAAEHAGRPAPAAVQRRRELLEQRSAAALRPGLATGDRDRGPTLARAVPYHQAHEPAGDLA